MKQISTLLIAALLIATFGKAQTVYNVTSNKNWSNNYPTTCNSCTFNISSGVTVTVDRNITLQNPTFNGGTVVVNDNSVTLQLKNGAGRSNFNNTKFVLNNKSLITGAAPMYLTNSTFTFKSEARFNPQQTLELSNSKLYFYGDSYMLATGSAINLKNNSMIVAGDGTIGSDAYLYMFGPFVTLYDNSAMVIANSNNYYFNWSPYYGAANNKWNITLLNAFNCGSGFPNSCAMASVYGPVNMLPSGVVAGNTLPVVLSDFSVRLWNNQTELSWITDQESNSDRFEVERSIDGTNWTSIAKIAAKGNSSIQSKYAFVDRTPAAGINYYRLKMVDLDNTFDFSEVKSVRTEMSTNLRVFPNPASDLVYVSQIGRAHV